MNSVLLIVLDGFGIAPEGPTNPVKLSSLPTISSLFHSYPNTTLKASGEAVGLPAGEVGNTEVGHINLGAGRIVYQDLPRINMSIADGTFYKNPEFLKAVEHVKKTSGTLHLLGLAGEGSVHSSLNHLFALLFFANENGIKDVAIHIITDGRDSPPKSALGVVSRIEEKIHQLGIGRIASVMGRYFAMDRDLRWERTEKAYRCLIHGSETFYPTAEAAIAQSYANGKTDEFVEPVNIIQQGKAATLIKEGDAVIFYNFRIDRPRQLSKAFALDDFENQANSTVSFDPYAVKYHKTHLQKEQIITPPFARGPKIKSLVFVTMTEYEKGLPVERAFPPIEVSMPLGRVISERSLAQLRVSESEKERFIGFYFNGQREASYPYEDRLIIPSPKVSTYDLAPEMSASEMTKILIEKLQSELYHFTLINFANADMVGHTGNFEACQKALQTLDGCLARIIQVAGDTHCTVIITADHGNIEQKINPQTGQPSTEHTSNPVPFVAVAPHLMGKIAKLQTGILADIAPTILKLLDISKPEDMTGRNLLEEIVRE